MQKTTKDCFCFIINIITLLRLQTANKSWKTNQHYKKSIMQYNNFTNIKHILILNGEREWYCKLYQVKPTKLRISLHIWIGRYVWCIWIVKHMFGDAWIRLLGKYNPWHLLARKLFHRSMSNETNSYYNYNFVHYVFHTNSIDSAEQPVLHNLERNINW